MPANYRFFKKGAVWILSGILGIGALILLLVAFLPIENIADNAAKKWLADHDISLEYNLASFTWRGISLEKLTFRDSEDAVLNNLTINYSLKNLWGKRVDTITATGLDITLRQTDNGNIHLAPADSLLALFTSPAETGNSTLPSLPFDELKIEDALLTYIPLQGEPIQAVLSANIKSDYSGDLHLLGAHIPMADGSKIEITDAILERQGVDVPFTFSIGRIAHDTKHKAYFTPMHAMGEIKTAKDNTQFDGMIVISDLLDRWVLNLSGKADMQAQTWNVAINQPPVFFESGILQPDQLFPFLRGMVKNAAGSFAVDGYAQKTSAEAEIESGGNFNFNNVSLSVKDTPINEVNGSIAFSSLFPLVTHGQQTLNVGEIILGLPLKGGSLKFTLNEKGKIELAPSTWQWANGQLKTSKITTDLETLTIKDLKLTAKDLAVEQLLSNFLKQGFSATGSLNGTLPVSFVNGAALIRNGHLATPGGGVIRYIPPAEDSPLQKGQSFQTDLLLSAVEDFQYDILTLDLNNKDERVLEVILHLRGRNPKLYNGQIIELNINLTGNLLEAIQSSLDIYSLPERLEEQLVP